MGGMETTKVKDYAAACGIPVALFTELLSERLDERVTPARVVDVRILDDARETIIETATEDLVDVRDALADARDDVRAAEADLRRSVQQALKEGMPATGVAQVLGVSRARVYQIRDGKR